VLRQIVGDRVPRRLRADEHVHAAGVAEIAVEVAGGHVHVLAEEQGRDSEAGRAETTRSLFRRLIGDHRIFAGDPTKAARGRAHERRERRAVVLSAHRAVAVHEVLERALHLVAEAAA
jgi:hypothetical protein